MYSRNYTLHSRTHRRRVCWGTVPHIQHSVRAAHPRIVCPTPLVTATAQELRINLQVPDASFVADSRGYAATIPQDRTHVQDCALLLERCAY